MSVVYAFLGYAAISFISYNFGWMKGMDDNEKIEKKAAAFWEDVKKNGL